MQRGNNVRRAAAVAGAGARAFAVVSVGCAVASVGCSDGRVRFGRARDAGPSVVVAERGSGGAPVVIERTPDDDALPGLALPGEARGALADAADVDAWPLAVATPLRVALRLAPAAGADLALELRAPDGALLATSDAAGPGAPEGIPAFALAAGEYRLVVRHGAGRPAPKSGRRRARADAAPPSAAARYTLEVAPAPSPGDAEEGEPNEALELARTLPLGGGVVGHIGWAGDRDAWRVLLAGAGDDVGLAVELDGVAELPLTMTLLDPMGTPLAVRSAAAGEAVALRNVALHADWEQVYVVVTSAPTRSSFVEHYQLRAAARRFALDSEEEPNDTPAIANPLTEVPLAEAGVRVGDSASSDVDHFVVPPAALARMMSFTLSGATEGATLSVVDAAGKVLGGPARVTGDGRKLALEGVPLAADAQHFVRVVGGGESEGRYRMTWALGTTPTTPVAPAAPAAPAVPEPPR
ncbi:MAG: hypothetical protein EXR73_02800 [Myxococcales bacterium]|nr:hypothetical protein [Myxococcales bacterium]